MSFKPEVQTVGGNGEWSGNALRFATEEEAVAYAIDLRRRWSAVTEIRVVPSNDPVTYRWDSQHFKAISLEVEAAARRVAFGN